MYRVVAGCESDNCPKIGLDGDTVAVQGYVSSTPGMGPIPSGENRVTMPLEEFKQLAREVLGL